MEKKEQVKWLHKAFSLLLRETRLWATAGDKEAAKDLMSQMAAEATLLKELGFSTNDRRELVKYQPLTDTQSKQYFLALEASRGNTNAAKQLLEIMAKSPLR